MKRFVKYNIRSVNMCSDANPCCESLLSSDLIRITKFASRRYHILLQTTLSNYYEIIGAGNSFCGLKIKKINKNIYIYS